MSDTWKLWEGETVAGKFPLARFLGGSERTGVFLTELREGDQVVKAAIKLVTANPQESELQLSRWQRAAELSHPHLISIYEKGRFELRSVPLAYIVMEWADENLAEIIPSRALTSAEAREMLTPVLDVLAYLHGNGFVHGNIKPANIMACGDQLKLSSDGLLRSGEPQDAIGEASAYDSPEMARGIIPMSSFLSPAGDIWSLGMTLVEVLTQNLPVARMGEQKDPQLPQSLPEPYLDIARHCLIRHPESRWTIAQVAARLEGRVPAPPIQAVPATPKAPVPTPPRQITPRAPRPPAKLGRYAVPIAAGLVLALTALFAGTRLNHTRAVAPQVPATTGDQPLAPPAPSEPTAAPRENSTKAYGSSAAGDEGNSNPAVAVPAAIHADTMEEEGTNHAAIVPAGSIVRGEVAHQVIPEVLASARNSIQGKVKVSVKVNVDRSGNVEDAELESPGPSKYFARAAIGAAQDWKFKPPMVGGQGVLSTWILRFQFRRDETTVVPTQEMP
jgi:TonB family protein